MRCGRSSGDSGEVGFGGDDGIWRLDEETAGDVAVLVVALGVEIRDADEADIGFFAEYGECVIIKVRGDDDFDEGFGNCGGGGIIDGTVETYDGSKCGGGVGLVGFGVGV